MKQIPKEGSAFRQMDATWRNIMTAVKQKPLIVDVCPQSAMRSATDCAVNFTFAASAVTAYIMACDHQCDHHTHSLVANVAPM